MKIEKNRIYAVKEPSAVNCSMGEKLFKIIISIAVYMMYGLPLAFCISIMELGSYE